mmetsp:Transcript_2881/g.3060  ORF Transcript_2881/g.3060 Transcript_2881/m.3060 type:complete len:364 (+) Transcript_2881:26-1117(+)
MATGKEILRNNEGSFGNPFSVDASDIKEVYERDDSVEGAIQLMVIKLKCRFCHIEGSKEDMILPCKCKNSQRHPECARNFIRSHKETTCETCRTPFLVEALTTEKREQNNHYKYWACGYMLPVTVSISFAALIFSGTLASARAFLFWSTILIFLAVIVVLFRVVYQKRQSLHIQSIVTDIRVLCYHNQTDEAKEYQSKEILRSYFEYLRLQELENKNPQKMFDLSEMNNSTGANKRSTYGESGEDRPSETITTNRDSKGAFSALPTHVVIKSQSIEERREDDCEDAEDDKIDSARLEGDIDEERTDEAHIPNNTKSRSTKGDIEMGKIDTNENKRLAEKGDVGESDVELSVQIDAGNDQKQTC